MENYVPYRKEGETQEDYRVRRKTQSIATKIWLKGRLLWEGSTYVKARDGKLGSAA